MTETLDNIIYQISYLGLTGLSNLSENSDPRAGSLLTLGHDLNNLCTEPLDDATYHIYKVEVLLFLRALSILENFVSSGTSVSCRRVFKNLRMLIHCQKFKFKVSYTCYLCSRETKITTVSLDYK